ncbi:hypothetical protein [Nocardia sp. NPDC020380]|uniref:hypothetical protein n=1 Tax=Nocardia sp. NPDC020380 TaxID=3364309 RepID=UPI0037BC9BC5
MVARDRSGGKIARSVSSCSECLAWGLMFAQGVCLACYNLAARYRDHVGQCPACRRQVPLKDGFCRLCWCQARLDRAADAGNARDAVVLAPYVAKVGYHQLFLADMYRPQARPPTLARRRGVKGRPLKPPPPIAHRPSPFGAQLVLLTDLSRTYRPGGIDLRSVAAPDNPWLAWALHLAHSLAEIHGFDPMVRRALNRNLIMLLATHADGDRIRVSEFHQLVRRRGNSLIHVIDVLSSMGILADDRPKVFNLWLEAKLDGLAPSVADHMHRWAHVLRDGGPRRHPRHRATATIYVNLVHPALLGWSQRYDHLREVTRDDVLAYLDEITGRTRTSTLSALRSLFRWAKHENLIFRNPPCARIRLSTPPRPIWQPLTAAEISAAASAADTPQARLCVVLAAVHAARPFTSAPYNSTTSTWATGASPSQATPARSAS